MPVRRATAFLGPRAFALLALLILAVEWLIVSQGALQDHPDFLSLGVTLDLVVGVPLLGYFLLVRPHRAPWWILLFLFIEGWIVAKLLLPAEHERFVDLAELLVPAVELALVGLLIVRARRLVQSYRSLRPHHVYAIDAVEETLAGTLGAKTSRLVTSEVAVVDYALRGWWRRPMTSTPGRRVFAYHNRQSYPAIFATFVFLVALETFIVHLVVSQWSVTGAWILSALGIVGLLWMLGDFQAMRHEPIVATSAGLEVRAGIRWRARIDWNDVKAVHTKKPPDAGPEVSLPVFGEPDFWIELHHVVAVRGIYGIQRAARLVGIGVDDPAGLRQLVEERLGTTL